MEVKDIISLINAVSEADVTNFHMQEGNLSLSISKLDQICEVSNTATGEISAVEIKDAENLSIDTKEVDVSVSVPMETNVEDGNIIEVTSPIVGIYYSAPGPEDEEYVHVGDRVRKGQVLCIIEAMKLMNDIECDYDGEIVEILVKNEAMVEYNQPLFRIRTI